MPAAGQAVPVDRVAGFGRRGRPTRSESGNSIGARVHGRQADRRRRTSNRNANAMSQALHTM